MPMRAASSVSRLATALSAQRQFEIGGERGDAAAPG